MIVRDAYVFVDINGEKTLAGRVQHVREDRAERYFFAYGKSYASRPDAYSIDPRQLPLSDKVVACEAMPLAFQDAGPDDYGRYLYEVLHGHKPDSPLDYLTDNGQASIGALSFSNDTSKPGLSRLLHSTRLDELVEAIDLLERNKPISEPMRQLLAPGTSLPGARPKALVTDDNGEQWIAKFATPNDIFDIPVAEYAAMTAARRMIDTAQVRLERIGRHNVFMTKRFDREQGAARHFLSAYTLLGADRARGATFYRDYGYPALANLTRQVSATAQPDRHELYRRMVVNAVLGNRDDHLKNHGFLIEPDHRRYRLSPAYDVVPAAGGTVHAIALDIESATASLPTLLRSAGYFGLSETQALSNIEQACEVVEHTMAIAQQEGMDPVSLQRLEQGMMTLSDGALVPCRQRGLHSLNLSGVGELFDAPDKGPDPSRGRR
ncbi:type II toxin-antitoxin system HipA family toxin [Marinimicrobium sp. ABcell2]|uniref:type II toxin-antitoxin system HipA family toxin n=1 Tax=Marinimicrobium sp. ABcell2 TaxID=3069751 RepID=UPI0027B5035A|nr:type II toxin-antitoxin system HipA family toxin [Marinimicrobium sp. ABcell2]MDQ2077561.1 type II toxin-antitoxin system HipA family toxin [Marinimicrobium sp. ABcell2]